mmetsp:Transcript_3735/g.13799  ORF Transcript_3735/g.13799 Transcript_3735/m.13799 type:complete len:386 (-) Transcript_3735:118-1275(-)
MRESGQRCATYIGVVPYLVGLNTASRFAYLSRCLAMATKPFSATTYSAVLPRCVTVLQSAPAASSSGTTPTRPFSHAEYSASLPLLVTAVVSAPCPSMSAVRRVWPFSAASMSGVWPLRVAALTSAPRATSSSAVRMWPRRMEQCSALSPPCSWSMTGVASLTSAPASSSAATISVCPADAASSSGGQPSRVRVVASRGWRSHSSRTISTLPILHATCSAFMPLSMATKGEASSDSSSRTVDARWYCAASTSAVTRSGPGAFTRSGSCAASRRTMRSKPCMALHSMSSPAASLTWTWSTSEKRRGSETPRGGLAPKLSLNTRTDARAAASRNSRHTMDDRASARAPRNVCTSHTMSPGHHARNCTRMAARPPPWPRKPSSSNDTP